MDVCYQAFPLHNGINKEALKPKTASLVGCCNMEAHVEHLHILCRICGRLHSKSHHVTYKCSEYTERVEMAFKVNMTEDLEEVHPKNFCNEYYKVQMQ